MKKLSFCSEFTLVMCFFLSQLASAQVDTLNSLPAVEISSYRPNQFATGQVKMESDKTLSNLTAQQGLQEFLQIATPLSYRSYGTGISSVSSRGTGSSHTALLWNGINIQNALSGTIDLPIFETGSGGKISVKYGASTALFGSGAIGATLFFDNEKPSEKGTKCTLNAGAGSFGYQQYSFNMKFSAGKIAGETRVSTQFAENEFTFRNTSELGSPLQKALNASFDRKNLTQHLFFELSRNQFLKVHFWHSQNRRALMPSLTSVAENAMLRDTSSRIVAEWSFFKEHTIVKLRSYFSSDNNVYTSNSIKWSGNKLRTFVSEAELNRGFGSHFHSRLALNYTQEQSLSSNFSGDHMRNRLAIVLNQTYKAAKIADFSLNLRQELYNGKTSPFTFSAGAERVVAPQLRLRAAVSRVYNLPALNDLYWINLGNPELKPEKGWSSEAGLSCMVYDENKQQLTLHFTAYQINIKNRILWLPEAGIWRPGNLNEMHSSGIEILGKYSRRFGDLTLTCSPQYQLASTKGDNRKQLIYVPLHNGSLTFDANFRKISVNWNQVASSKRFMSSDLTTWTNGFTVSNLSTSYLLKLHRTSTQFSVRIMNLFNSNYQMIQFYPNPGRNFKADITFSF